ncbi:DUF6702 family protein [Chitinophaga japonensis]|uniref:Uncharacterized protein n=1 Tax=Chitinophaga japonensis TaxID=104662 RepID=A0A562T5M5_CHIJA|nr:DUF6702 family protein [Chitinophaga japonensis]TWI88376.1 hypothetical protein LX66_2461 [Chitinophaga japonensis]
MGLILCKWLVPVWYVFVHPFYVSVTEIRHNAAKQELEISCRIFSDDLEQALKTQYKSPSLDIIRPANRKTVDSFLSDYITKHLRITADGKPLHLQYLGYQIAEDATWCFLEVKQVAAVKRLQVSNNILYAEHPNQINMMHVIVQDERKSTKLDNPEQEAEFRF